MTAPPIRCGGSFASCRCARCPAAARASWSFPSTFDAEGVGPHWFDGRWPPTAIFDWKQAGCGWSKGLPDRTHHCTLLYAGQGCGRACGRVKIIPGHPILGGRYHRCPGRLAARCDAPAAHHLRRRDRHGAPRRLGQLVLAATPRPACGPRATPPASPTLFGRATVERRGLRTLGCHVRQRRHARRDHRARPRFAGAHVHGSATGAGPTTGTRWLRRRRHASACRSPWERAIRPVSTWYQAPGGGRTGQPRAPVLLAVRALERFGSILAVPATTRRSPWCRSTYLGVHAKVGADEGVVWVTGASDGKPRGGADVKLFDPAGRIVASARTDSSGDWRASGPISGATRSAADFDGRPNYR